MIRYFTPLLLAAALATPALAQTYTLSVNLPDASTWQQTYTLKEIQEANDERSTTIRKSVIDETAIRQDDGFIIKRRLVSFIAETDSELDGLKPGTAKALMQRLSKDMASDYITDAQLRPTRIDDWTNVNGRIRLGALDTVGSIASVGIDIIFKNMTAEAAPGILVPTETFVGHIRGVALETGVAAQGQVRLPSGISPDFMDAEYKLTLNSWDPSQDSAQYTYQLKPSDTQIMGLIKSFLTNIFTVLAQASGASEEDIEEIEAAITPAVENSTLTYVIDCEVTMAISTGQLRSSQCFSAIDMNMSGRTGHFATWMHVENSPAGPL